MVTFACRKAWQSNKCTDILRSDIFVVLKNLDTNNNVGSIFCFWVFGITMSR